MTQRDETRPKATKHAGVQAGLRQQSFEYATAPLSPNKKRRGRFHAKNGFVAPFAFTGDSMPPF